MFKAGDRVEQVVNTKTIPKGTIGNIEYILNGSVQRDCYEVKFTIAGNTQYRLRYGDELKAAPVNVSTTQQMKNAMGLPNPPAPVSVNPFMAALKKTGKQGQLIKYTNPQSSVVYVVEDLDDYHGRFKILSRNGDNTHPDVGVVNDHSHWTRLGWVGVGFTGMYVVAKLNKCTCGAEKTYGIDSGHSSWCDKAKAS